MSPAARAARLLAPLLLVHALIAAAATPDVGAGQSHGAALGADGLVRTWGSDAQGQLGIGRVLFAASPAPVAGLDGVSSIAAGAKHALALTTDGRVLSWGQNQNGELGDGTIESRSRPMPVPGLTGVRTIGAGNGHSVALKMDGSVWIWGAGNSRTPRRVEGLTEVAQVAVGHATFFLARRNDGSVWAWGANDFGQLGDGTVSTSFRDEARQVPGLANVRSVAAGSYHSLALLNDGTVRAWGYNTGGTLCDGTDTHRSAPITVSGLANVRNLWGGAAKTIAVREDGAALVCGWAAYGIGVPGGDQRTPVPLVGAQGALAFSNFSEHTFGLMPGGALVAWGVNHRGQLGDGTTTGWSTPRPVTWISGVREVGAGQQFTLALKTDGTVWSWGDDTHGQLGIGATIFRSIPSAVSLPGVDKLAVGGWHNVALKADGSVWAWGDSRAGQVGDGTGTNRESPVAVTGLGAGSGITDVAAGGIFTLALGSDGRVWSWGDNFAHQSGERENSNGSVPARVLGLPLVTRISAGGSHSVVLAADRSVWTWGHNDFGQLGDGTQSGLYGGRKAARQVAGLTDVREIAAGRSHTVALKGDGTLWAWGGNFNGQLGDGTHETRLVPVRVAANLDNVVAIAAGYAHTLALRSDGTVWAWGGNTLLGAEGEGDGTLPRRVRGLTDIVAVSAGAFSLATKRDGTVWGWGWNDVGQLGDGTLVARSTPVVTLREGGAGRVETGDWFLDLAPAVAGAIPPESVPVFVAITSALASTVSTDVRFRAGDIGTTASTYVFALAHASVVRSNAAMPAKDLGTDCVLAQLDANGGLQAMQSSNLQAYASGVLTAQGQAVTILDKVASANVAGATFFVGYGASPEAMLASGTNRGVVGVPGGTECRPEAPQAGWWWNPQEDGRGYSIEVQGNKYFFAAFLYDAGGRSTWLVSTGTGVSFDGARIEGDLLEARGGQTLGGTYPGRPAISSIGRLRMTFSSATRGAIEWPGGTVPIERFSIIPSGLALAAPPGTPESGWWWNPDESGRGFFLEWQGGTADIAGYMYDDQGNPVWYLTYLEAGAQSGAVGRTVAREWWSFANGMPLMGPWRQHQRVNANVAPVTIRFDSPTEAFMTLPNGQGTRLVRHRF